MIKHFGIIAASALLASVPTRSADACGGFFCNQAQPVNQAAERIIFSQNGDDTVTAVIEIMYQGPAEQFSWLLPITSVPEGGEIAVASKAAFDRLQARTNPSYRLNVSVEGQCDASGGMGTGGSASFASGGGGGGGPMGQPPVNVEASGQVGSFEYAVISVDSALPEPADAAVEWLTDNGYDVPQGSRGLLGPYLADGMFLLALKLQKGASAGSIRPIVITYDGSKPMIPIKLTAVAANDDMGVLTFLLADGQAVPLNYNALELNEARINWFNPNSNYNEIVIAAADEASGHGFVTEYAAPALELSDVAWSEVEDDLFEELRQTHSNVSSLPLDVLFDYSGFDGFWDVFRDHITLPPGNTVEEVQNCFQCFDGAMRVEPASFFAALEEEVIEPMRMVQRLIDGSPYVSRLYTTMSAAEMTVDPLFSFNPSLPDVSNVHVAERIIECAPGLTQFLAPWRIELPQGDVVRGGPNDVGNWPSAFDDLPANRRILRRGEQGPGRVLEDNTDEIAEVVTRHNASAPPPPPGRNGAGGSGGSSASDRDNDGRADGMDGSPPPSGRDGGCSVAATEHSHGALALLLALTTLWRRGARKGTRSRGQGGLP
jgi:hypothetical protein